jgi:chromosome segregation ATPase
MNNDAPARADIRARYEAATETVAQIAADIDTTPHKLTLRARAEGWLLRTTQKTKKPKPQNTRDTIRRLKELLQNRLTHLESQLSEIGAEVNALARERDIRATNTLVRTLEKVLELEHKDRKQRSHRARHTRKLNDTERDELARRIAALQTEPQAVDQGTEAAACDGDPA